MIAIDTETTGLWWQHDTEAFAIGTWDGGNFRHVTRDVDPYDRSVQPWETKVVRHCRDLFHTPVVMQNSKFDLKALCKSGVFDWREPSEPEFWENIIELSDLIHLHDSTDTEFKGSLKDLVPKYLEKEYVSEDELERVVKRCQTYARNRLPGWAVASESTVPQAKKGGNTKWHKMDMWLPAALLKSIGSMELIDYFGDDYPLLRNCLPKYLRDDCENTWDLAAGMMVRLSDRHGDDLTQVLNLNRQIAHVVWGMEIEGVRVSAGNIRRGIDACTYWVKETEKVCADLTGETSFTPATLRRVLFDTFGLEPVSYTAKQGLPQVGGKVIPKLKKQAIDRGLTRCNKYLSHLLAHGKYTTKRSYLEGYLRNVQHSSRVPYDVIPDHNFLFPSMKATGTGTTRFSSNNPNGQNIEKAGATYDEFEDVAELMQQSPSLRSNFRPPKGHWWFPVDYSQLQLRIFAAATQDPALIQSFDDGYDFHTFMAMVIFDLPPGQEPTTLQRRIAKNVNFGFIFGASEKKIDETAGRKGLYKYLMNMFPGAKEFIEETKEAIASTGVVHTLGGYPLSIPLRANPWNGDLSYAAHMGVNYVVQGTEGEIVKRAMRDTSDYLRANMEDSRIVMQIHDEIIFQTPARPKREHITNLCRIMFQAGQPSGVCTPVDAELCTHNLSRKVSIVI